MTTSHGQFSYRYKETSMLVLVMSLCPSYAIWDAPFFAKKHKNHLTCIVIVFYAQQSLPLPVPLCFLILPHRRRPGLVGNLGLWSVPSCRRQLPEMPLYATMSLMTVAIISCKTSFRGSFYDTCANPDLPLTWDAVHDVPNFRGENCPAAYASVAASGLKSTTKSCIHIGGLRRKTQ